MLIEHLRTSDLDEEAARKLARDLVVLGFALALTASDNGGRLPFDATIPVAKRLADEYLKEPSV